MTDEEEYPLPDVVGGMPSDRFEGTEVPFSATEINSFKDFDTYLEGENTDLYLGDGKNV